MHPLDSRGGAKFFYPQLYQGVRGIKGGANLCVPHNASKCLKMPNMYKIARLFFSLAMGQNRA